MLMVGLIVLFLFVFFVRLLKRFFFLMLGFNLVVNHDERRHGAIFTTAMYAV
ncbi:MAG: hypothetical protein O7D30_05390 [Rickettsia endosymbiont of Ixodes persulcatus]|nr:hypothetical protein [Rickettsia endosymbiont of Ixodes persulcatus]